jgi:hypothetical protein
VFALLYRLVRDFFTVQSCGKFFVVVIHCFLLLINILILMMLNALSLVGVSSV